MTLPQIDVLLPTYNSARYLPETLDSIRNQTLRAIRILVIDDGSTDDTRELVERIQQIDDRVVYVRQENGGIVSALNAGLALCEAPLVARHDADDLSDPERLEKQLAHMDANPDCVALSCLARHIDADGKPLGTVSTLKDLTKADDTAIPAAEPYLLHPMLMARLSDMRRVGGYRYVYNAEDSDLYWRLLERNKLHILPEVLGSYRLHAGSLSAASIVNGRQTSVWSQLAALSSQRRRAGAADLVFDPSFMAAVRKETTLDAIHRAASASLSESERTWLSSAASAKLLALSYYRPFEPDASDIRFIRQAMKADPQLKTRNGYAAFRESLISASIRLLIGGDMVKAFTLAELAYWPKLLARVAFRVAFPKSLKGRFKAGKGSVRGAAL